MQSTSLRTRSKRDTRPCIWMKAGVVSRKVCKNDYECPSCRFDRALGRAAEENLMVRRRGESLKGPRSRIVSWKKRLRELPAWKQPCIHHLKEKIEFRACNNDYNCRRCEFDQYFHDQYSVNAAVRCSITHLV